MTTQLDQAAIMDDMARWGAMADSIEVPDQVLEPQPQRHSRTPPVNRTQAQQSPRSHQPHQFPTTYHQPTTADIPAEPPQPEPQGRNQAPKQSITNWAQSLLQNFQPEEADTQDDPPGALAEFRGIPGSVTISHWKYIGLTSLATSSTAAIASSMIPISPLIVIGGLGGMGLILSIIGDIPIDPKVRQFAKCWRNLALSLGVGYVFWIATANRAPTSQPQVPAPFATPMVQPQLAPIPKL